MIIALLLNIYNNARKCFIPDIYTVIRAKHSHASLQSKIIICKLLASTTAIHFSVAAEVPSSQKSGTVTVAHLAWSCGWRGIMKGHCVQGYSCMYILYSVVRGYP